jgi:hypothetical protein
MRQYTSRRLLDRKDSRDIQAKSKEFSACRRASRLRKWAKKRSVPGLYMSILSPFPTPHGAARGFFNSLLGDVA